MSAESAIPLHSFIDVDEYAFYTDLVVSRYTGSGLIVDGGCFAGASTLALCKGLVSMAYAEGRRRVVAIDRFVATDPYVVEHFSSMGVDVRFGESFLPIFMANLDGHLSRIDVRAGELVQVGRIDRPIEILVVDIAKSSALNAYILSNWFKQLVPGSSFVVHQDFYAPSHPWIATSMGCLLDYFGIVEEKIGETAVFRLERHIPPAALANAATLKVNSRDAVEMLERMVNAISPENNAPLRLMQALLFHRLGDTAKAQQLLARILRAEPPSDRKWERWLSFALVAIDPGALSSAQRMASAYFSDAAIRLGR